jgi:hypothetical protein
VWRRPPVSVDVADRGDNGGGSGNGSGWMRVSGHDDRHLLDDQSNSDEGHSTNR